MRNFDSDRFLCLATAEASPTRLARGHSRRFGFDPYRRYPSTFLRSLRSLSLTRVLRYYGRSDSCRPGSSAPYGSMNSVSGNRQVSLSHVSDLPIPPSPTTPRPWTSISHATPHLVQFPYCRGSRLHPILAGSPTLEGRIEFVILRMDRSPPAAPHPASRRRSSSWFQAGERIPGEDLHLSDQPRFQAHEEAASCRFTNVQSPVSLRDNLRCSVFRVLLCVFASLQSDSARGPQSC